MFFVGFRNTCPVRTQSCPMRTHVFRLLDSCVSQKGICPQSMFVILSCIGVLDAAGPIQRYHSWLVRARRKCPDASKLSTNPPDGSCRARNILPTHLPVYPRGNVFPKSRPARIRYFAACNAWTAVEWIIAAHNYYELGCPKSFAEYEKVMGGLEDFTCPLRFGARPLRGPHTLFQNPFQGRLEQRA